MLRSGVRSRISGCYEVEEEIYTPSIIVTTIEMVRKGKECAKDRRKGGKDWSLRSIITTIMKIE